MKNWKECEIWLGGEEQVIFDVQAVTEIINDKADPGAEEIDVYKYIMDDMELSVNEWRNFDPEQVAQQIITEVYPE